MAEMTIKRFGVFSVAKMYGLLMFVFGLIIGVIYGLIFIIMGASMASLAREEAAIGGFGTIGVGIGMMIGIPVFYGVLGFVGGIIGALIYNALAGVVGGVKFELQAVQQEYAPPPPPNQWAPQ